MLTTTAEMFVKWKVIIFRKCKIWFKKRNYNIKNIRDYQICRNIEKQIILKLSTSWLRILFIQFNISKTHLKDWVGLDTKCMGLTQIEQRRQVLFWILK